MSKSSLIWCGPDAIPSEHRKEYPKSVHLNSHPIHGNVHLKIRNISKKLVMNLKSLVMDLLEIGSYVYCADQSVSRGGPTWQRDGEYWRRNFIFDIPVRNPDLWNQTDIRDGLAKSLSFLSDDTYEFSFRKLADDIEDESYFEYDEGQAWFNADSILLFSGGLDSLAGMIHEILDKQHKVILVSHRPVSKTSKRQRDLLQRFKKIYDKSGTFLHIPVWVNKDKGLTKDTNQRTRSFLYAVLAASIAYMQDIDTIKFYENGVVSINLPISPQLVGARASRSTHPKALHYMEGFFKAVFEREFHVENPYLLKTKSEVVEVVKDHEMEELIRLSNSCSHIRTTDRVVDHCGTCSQCIDRRIAILHNKIDENNDPHYRYQTQLFIDPLPDKQVRTMVESFINHATSLEKMPESDFFQRFGEVSNVLGFGHLSSHEMAENVYDLHVRHGKQVCKVVDDQISQHSSEIRGKKIDPNSLLALAIKQPSGRLGKITIPATFPTPEGTRWEDIKIELISNESVRISVRNITKRYTAIDMGFRDHRMGDLPDKQWKALKLLAYSNGELSWGSRDAEPGIQKHIQRLRKILNVFFGLDENPIKGYRKKEGYVTRFKIIDKSYGN